MIPEELHLRNFLSHQETDLELRGVHLASLVGENGAGKSSLLDAITWVTWGRSRAPYGREENLIYHGETWLEVEFFFRMPYQGNNEQRFRILRRREIKRRRATTSILDFQIQAEDGWHSLNGNSIRETQARIIEQLGLEYDTFVNSAYLRQGHADEFTIQSSSERKRVLSNILGLDRWAEYQDTAKKRLAEASGQMQELERRLAEIKQELERRAEIETKLQEAERSAQEASVQLQKTQENVNELTRLKEQATAITRQIQELQQRLEYEQEKLGTLEQETTNHRARRDDYHMRIAQAQEIEKRYQDYQDTQAEERSWSEKLSQTAQLQEEKSQLEKAISQAGEALRNQIHTLEQEAGTLERTISQTRGHIEQEIKGLQGQIHKLEERIPPQTLAQKLKKAQEQLAYFEQITETREETQRALQDAGVEQSRITERNRQLRELMDTTKTNLEALADADANCPLCRQPLSPEHQLQLLETIQAEGQSMGYEYRNNQQQLQTLKTEITTLKGEIQQHEIILRKRTDAEQTIARLNQQQEQGEAAQAEITATQEQVANLQSCLNTEAYGEKEREKMGHLQEEINALQTRLDEKAYAAEERRTLKTVHNKLSELGYDAEMHNALKERLQTLSNSEAEYRELEKARVGVQGEEETLKRLTRESAEQQKQLDEIESAIKKQEDDLKKLQPRLAETPAILKALQNARKQESEARQQVGAARQTLAALDTQGKRLKRLTKQQEELATRVALLKELREAFGVNGIPAMIIEHTLPELEEEANRILQQLTSGRMHVRFETQRENKSGTVRETLDIIISDEKGTRPYENFSGGEQFRVNFAIRVALSRLLAERSGTRLRSLFVDEGFGSLDTEGRQRLVEAVKTVQDDFDLILVITHIDELQDAFPTRIQVTKVESGSQIEIL